METIRIVFIVFFLIFIFWGCGGIIPLEVVSYNTAMVASFELSEIPPESKIGSIVYTRDFYEQLSAVNLESEKVSELLIFIGEQEHYDDGEISGIIVQGEFDAVEKINSLVDESWSRQEYDGAFYYLKNNSDKCIMALSDSSLVFGRESGIQSSNQFTQY